MTKKDVFVRGIDEDVYLEFKSKVVLKKTKIGDALTEAMKKWIEQIG